VLYAECETQEERDKFCQSHASATARHTSITVFSLLQTPQRGLLHKTSVQCPEAARATARYESLQKVLKPSFSSGTRLALHSTCLCPRK
jgi:Fe-S-cluster containining protein